jgi:hypothetical protein
MGGIGGKFIDWKLKFTGESSNPSSIVLSRMLVSES